MLCKLSFKNISKSFKDYTIYFFTLILGVSIFYVFNAIESQTVMMDVTSNTRNIIDLMTNMLSGVSVFVSFILGFLIIYASRFLMKRRNKEFGIYLTLGMSKQKISFLLLFETFIIGLISLVIGLGAGVFLSQWMSILVVNLFEADMTSFQFVFSLSACLKTIFYFGIIYLVVMIFNTISIRKCKLIDLLQASKKSEKISMKNLYCCILVFLFSASMLAIAYSMVTVNAASTLDTVDKIFLPIGMGIVGTYGVFWSLSGLILKTVQKLKWLYYKGLNSFTFRQISSNVQTAVFSMSIICILLFVTICVLSSSLSIKNSMTENLKTLAPLDVEFEKERNLSEKEAKNHYRYTLDMVPDSYLSLEETLEKFDFSIQDDLVDPVLFHLYSMNDVLMSNTLGSYYKEAEKKYPMMNFHVEELFISVSEYNNIAKRFHLDVIDLKDDEYVVVADYDSMIPLREEGLKRHTPITISGNILAPKYEKVVNGFYTMSSNHINTGLFVVPDGILNDSFLKKEIVLGNYRENVEEKVAAFEKNSYIKKTTLDINTKKGIYESSIGLGALVTFIGLYLGIIFLISSAAILALKELSESSDNKSRFLLLRKLGADDKLISKALFRQIGVFFLFPLFFAIIHSIFGILFCNYILSTFGNSELLPSIVMTAIFLIFIYGGYFLITYWCSKNMIKERL